MTYVASAPEQVRNRWRHDLNGVTERLAVVRQSIGVLGAMHAKGSLEGLALDLERAVHALTGMQAEVADIIEQAKGSAAQIFDNDCYMYCLAHRKRVRWLAAPMWWHHTSDLSTCCAMWDARAPRLDGRP
jgi:hypothetical protein